MEKTQKQYKLSQGSFLFFLLYDAMVLQTTHTKNYLLFGSGSPSYIHLISAHQKNLLITGVIRYEERSLLHHVSLLMVLKFLGDALTVIRSYQITKALILTHVRVTKQDSGP